MTIYHASCRDAKTAEEYLLKCLFKAEDERDEAIAYCDGVRKAEEERIKAEKEAQEELKEKAKNAPVFSVKETKTVKYKVAQDYKFYDKDYGLADTEVLTNALSLNDEDLYEWACKSYHGEKSWHSVIPIERSEKTFDYVFAFSSDDGESLYTFISDECSPESFDELVTGEANTGVICPISKDAEIKALAIAELREALQRAISRLLKKEQQ